MWWSIGGGIIIFDVVPSFMGLISPAPDYMDVLIILRKVPKGAMIQATENGLVWYL